MLVSLIAGPALAADDDDFMGGFDDDFDVAELDSLETETPAWLAALPFGEVLHERVDVSGSIATGAVWSYLSHTNAGGRAQDGRSDFGGLSRLDLDGFLQVDILLPFEWQARAEVLAWYDFVYQIQGRGDFSTAVLDAYEWQIDSGEVYVTGPLNEIVDLTIGRKVVNWGRSDTFRVVDVVNPLDNKEPGLVDIEDLRRPKAMAKLDVSSGPWGAQFLVIPEHRYDRQPPIGSDFVPAVFAGGSFNRTEINDRSDFEGTPGFAGKFDGRFSGWDFSLYGAYVDESSRTIDLVSPFPLSFESKPNRFGMLGAAGNITRGAFLFKGEFAWLSQIRTLIIEGPPLTPAFKNVERDRLDTMVGVEYYGPDSLTIALEIVNRHLIDHPGGPTGRKEFTPQDNFETGLRISRPFFRERLDVTVLGIVFGEKMQDGGLVRASADFELTDSLKLEGGWLIFFGGPDRGIGAFESNDRVYGEIKYSF